MAMQALLFSPLVLPPGVTSMPVCVPAMSQDCHMVMQACLSAHLPHPTTDTYMFECTMSTTKWQCRYACLGPCCVPAPLPGACFACLLGPLPPLGSAGMPAPSCCVPMPSCGFVGRPGRICHVLVQAHGYTGMPLSAPPFTCLLYPSSATWRLFCMPVMPQSCHVAAKATMFSPAVFQHHYIASPNATFHVTSKHILYPSHVPAWLTHLPSSVPPCGGPGMHLHAYHLPVAPGSTGIPVQVYAVSQHDRLTARADLACSLSAT